MTNKNKTIDRATLDKLMDRLYWNPEAGTITWRHDMPKEKKEKHDDIKEDKKLIKSMVKAKDLKKKK